MTDVGDVWGIGRRFCRMLEYQGVKTAYDLSQKSRSWVRSKMTVMGEKTWLELQGTPCLEQEENFSEKQQICTSRSFGHPITDFDSLLSAVVNLASHGVSKLRKQKSVTKSLCVFAHTNRFKEDAYQPSRTIQLSFHTADLAEIAYYCRQILTTIYLSGHEYKRAGVILMDIIPEAYVQKDLFDPRNRDKQKQLNAALDKIALKNGKEAVKLAVQGDGYYSHIVQQHLSKRYSTNLNEIIQVKAK